MPYTHLQGPLSATTATLLNFFVIEGVDVVVVTNQATEKAGGVIHNGQSVINGAPTYSRLATVARRSGAARYVILDNPLIP